MKRISLISKAWKCIGIFVVALAVFRAGAATQQLLANVVDFKFVVDGQERQLNEDVVVINDRTYVPVRAMSELLNKQVGWDGQTNTVSITSNTEIAEISLTPEEIAAEGWLPFIKDGLWGLMDTEGNVKIPPMSYEMIQFQEGLAPVLNSLDRYGKYGYINIYGEVVLDYQYWDASQFNEGVAVVTTDDYFYRYIDHNGNFVFPTKFHYAEPFKNGYAKVSLRELTDEEVGRGCGQNSGPFTYIDKSGKTILKDEFRELHPFNNAFAYGVTMDGEKVYVDQRGNHLNVYSDPIALRPDSGPIEDAFPNIERDSAGNLIVRNKKGEITGKFGKECGGEYCIGGLGDVIYTDGSRQNSFFVTVEGKIVMPKE